MNHTLCSEHSHVMRLIADARKIDIIDLICFSNIDCFRQFWRKRMVLLYTIVLEFIPLQALPLVTRLMVHWQPQVFLPQRVARHMLPDVRKLVF